MNVELAPGITPEELYWPIVTLRQRIELKLGMGDKEFGLAYREANWIARRILESCRACRLHSPGEENRLPDITVYIPAAPYADPAYNFWLHLPPAVRVGRIGETFVQDLKARLGGRFDVELLIDSRGPWVRVPLNKTPRKPPACTLADLGEPPQTYHLPLPLGLAQHGPYWADLAAAPHALFAGATGSGKSTLIHACLHFILPRAEVWGIDLKLVELTRYRRDMARLATEPEEVEPLLAALFQETRRRLAEMQQRNSNTWTGERLVLVVDELAEVTLASKGDTQMLLRLTQLGRAAGVHVLLATQRPSVQIIPGDLKANIPLRVALALPTAVDSRVVLDREGAEQLSPPGDALVLQGHKLTRVSTPNFKAPPAPLDLGDAADPHLTGLTLDERAAYKALLAGDCRATRDDLMKHFHWGATRAMRALRGLRASGVLNDGAFPRQTAPRDGPPAPDAAPTDPNGRPPQAKQKEVDTSDEMVGTVGRPADDAPADGGPEAGRSEDGGPKDGGPAGGGPEAGRPGGAPPAPETLTPILAQDGIGIFFDPSGTLPATPGIFTFDFTPGEEYVTEQGVYQLNLEPGKELVTPVEDELISQAYLENFSAELKRRDDETHYWRYMYRRTWNVFKDCVGDVVGLLASVVTDAHPADLAWGLRVVACGEYIAWAMVCLLLAHAAPRYGLRALLVAAPSLALTLALREMGLWLKRVLDRKRAYAAWHATEAWSET